MSAASGVAVCGALVYIAWSDVDAERIREGVAIDKGSFQTRSAGGDVAFETVTGTHLGVAAGQETSLSVLAEGPAGYRSLLNRLIAGGLMADFGSEFARLLGGEPLAISIPCDLETFLGQMKVCTTPEEVRAALAPFAEALRAAQKNNDPNLPEIQRQLGIALLFAAEQVAESSTLTAEQQLDTLVKIGGVLVAVRQPQLALALNDVALDFTSIPDSQRNRKNIDAVLRGRLEVAARVQDLQLFDAATERWIQTSKDQSDSSLGSRWRLYAQRLATFPPEQVNSQGGASWPGLAQAPTTAIVNIGTNWLKLPPGADRAGYVAARDGLILQLDQVIRERTVRGDHVEDMNRLVGFRNKLASARVR